MQKVWRVRFIVPAIVALIIAGAAAGGLVLAINTEEPAEVDYNSGYSEINRLAKYLTVTPIEAGASGAELSAALKPSVMEAVANGAITQGQADELLAWLRSAPEAAFSLPRRLEQLNNGTDDLIFRRLRAIDDNVEARIAQSVGVEIHELSYAAGILYTDRFFRWGYGIGLERIANQLDLPESRLRNAYRDAEQQQDAALAALFAQLVAFGPLDGDEADELLSWLNNTPGVLGGRLGNGLGGLRGGFSQFIGEDSVHRGYLSPTS